MKHPSNHRGIIGGITEIIITLAVAGVVLGGIATLSLRQATTVRNQATALQFQQVYNAAADYIRAEQDSLKQSMVASGTIAYTCAGVSQPGKYVDVFATLKAKNYLSPYFGTTNPYGQPYQVMTTAWCDDTASHTYSLRAWVVTTRTVGQSRAIDKQDIARIAAMSGDIVGYIPYATDPAYNSIATPPTGSKILGAFGSWQTTTAAQLLPNLNLPAGYLAAPVLAGGNTTVNDYLYRHPVPGNPEANKMATDLGMDGDGAPHDIIGAKNILGQNLLATDAVYAGWTMDSSGTLQTGTGAGTIEARGNVISTEGDITAQSGNITATGGDITAQSGNITATGGTITAAGATGTGGTLAGQYMWLNPSNPITVGTPCPGRDGTLTYNHTLGNDGDILICRGAPEKWQIFKSDIKMEQVCHGDIVAKSHADCKTNETPVAALLGLNEQTPVNVCAIRHVWQCYKGTPANSNINLSNSVVTYNGNTIATPPCSGIGCIYHCTPTWQQTTNCMSHAMRGVRGWTREDTTSWQFFIAKYLVAYGAYVWLDDPTGTQSNTTLYPSSDFPGLHNMETNPWCEENYSNTLASQAACAGQTPTQDIQSACAGVLYFCLPPPAHTPAFIASPAVLFLSPKQATFAISGAKEGTMAYASTTFTVQNLGDQNTPTTLSTTLSSTANFSITSNSCTGRILAPNATCTLTIRAQADHNGALIPSILTVSADGSPQTADLSGTASGFVAVPTSDCSGTIGDLQPNGTIYVACQNGTTAYFAPNPTLFSPPMYLYNSTWNNSSAYCNTLSAHGLSDWELPPASVLSSMVTNIRLRSAFYQGYYYWASDPGTLGSAVASTTGAIIQDARYNLHYAVCVRTN